MKPVVFDTVIDGIIWTFQVEEGISSFRHWIVFGKSGTLYSSISSEISEEDAILKLVKLLEK